MGFEGLSQPRHPGLAVWANQRQKTTALPSRQGLSAIGIAARSWPDCQSFSHLSLASNQKGPPHSDSAPGGPTSRHGQAYQVGSMKISSQLANNFDYCSAEGWPKYFFSPSTGENERGGTVVWIAHSYLDPSEPK